MKFYRIKFKDYCRIKLCIDIVILNDLSKILESLTAKLFDLIGENIFERNKTISNTASMKSKTINQYA